MSWKRSYEGYLDKNNDEADENKPLARGKKWTVWKCDRKDVDRVAFDVQIHYSGDREGYDLTSQFSEEVGREGSPIRPKFRLRTDYYWPDGVYGGYVWDEEFFLSPPFDYDGKPTRLLYYNTKFSPVPGEKKFEVKEGGGIEGMRKGVIPLVYDSRAKKWGMVSLETSYIIGIPGISSALEKISELEEKESGKLPIVDLGKYKRAIVTNRGIIDSLYKNLKTAHPEYEDPFIYRPKINPLRRDGKYGEILSNAAESLRRNVKSKVSNVLNELRNKVEGFVSPTRLRRSAAEMLSDMSGEVFISRGRVAIGGSEAQGKREKALLTEKLKLDNAILARCGQDTVGYLETYKKNEKDEINKVQVITVCDGVGSGRNSHRVSSYILQSWHKFLESTLRESELSQFDGYEYDLPIMGLYANFIEELKKDPELKRIRGGSEQNDTTLTSALIYYKEGEKRVCVVTNGDSHGLVVTGNGVEKIITSPKSAHVIGSDGRERLASSVCGMVDERVAREHYPEFYGSTLGPGDVVLVLSDAPDKDRMGRNGAIKEISRIIKENPDPTEKLRKFLNRFARHDDISYAIVREPQN